MKKVILIIISIIIISAVIVGAGIIIKNQLQKQNTNQLANEKSNTEESAVTFEGKKILIATFYQSSNTKAIANLIKQNVGGDMFTIETVKTYPNDEVKIAEIAQEEQEQDARPELKETVKNMEQYDIVFIGYPIWYGTMPMAMVNFLEQYDFTGKKVIPFCNYNINGIQASEKYIRVMFPEINLSEGLEIKNTDIEDKETETKVKDWIEKLKNEK